MSTAICHMTGHDILRRLNLLECYSEHLKFSSCFNSLIPVLGISVVKVELISLCLSGRNMFPVRWYFWWLLITDCLVCSVPSPPWNVTAMQLNAHQVLVSWQAPRSPNGTIVSYVIFQTPPVPPVQKLQIGSKTSFIMVSDYEADINYSFWVSDIQVKMCVYVVLHLTLIMVLSSSCMLFCRWWRGMVLMKVTVRQ